MNRRLRVVPDPDTPAIDDRRKLTLRLPDDLAMWLEQRARENDRSVNAEITAQLRRNRNAYRQP